MIAQLTDPTMRSLGVASAAAIGVAMLVALLSMMDITIITVDAIVVGRNCHQDPHRPQANAVAMAVAAHKLLADVQFSDWLRRTGNKTTAVSLVLVHLSLLRRVRCVCARELCP